MTARLIIVVSSLLIAVLISRPGIHRSCCKRSDQSRSLCHDRGRSRAHCCGHAEDDRRRQHVHRAAGWTWSCAGPPRSSRRPRAARASRSSTSARRDADAAVAAAWAAYKPDAKWPLKVANDSPRQGRLDRTGADYTYQTSPNEKRDVGADAPRANDVWTVVIYDMAQAVGEKRGAQVGLIFGRLLPKGYDARDRSPARRRTRSTRRGSPSSEVRRGRREGDRRARRLASASSRTARSCSPAASACASSAAPRRSTPTRCFMIASNTKALTTLMLAKLVDAGEARPGTRR